MKIATAQTIVSKDISSNASAIRQALSDAAEQGVRLVNFCEGALSGYSKAQIASPECWSSFDWARQEKELRGIAELCGKLGLYAIVGGAHRLSETTRPHNSLYVLSDRGDLLTRYDKRFLSNSEIQDWYTPGRHPVLFSVDGYRFGCALCIECQFPEVFMDYEKRGADAVLFGSYGIPEHFQRAIQAHAGLNCFWISAATPAQEAAKGPAGIVGPDGKWSSRCNFSSASSLALSILDRDDPDYEIPIKRARPWRASARLGTIYKDKMVEDQRSRDKTEF